MNPNEDDPDWQSWLDTRGLKVGTASEDLVPLPSGGTFAEAVLGRYNCAEKLDLTRFWNWQDSPIPLLPSDIAAIQSGNHDTSDDVKSGQLSNPIINVSAPTTLPEPTGLAAILAAIQNVNMFRDMSGLQGTIQLAQAATNASSAGAMSAGQIAGQNLANQLQADTERQRISAQKELGMAQILTGGIPNSSKGGQNISQDGAKVNYFDKTQSEGGLVTDGPTSQYSRNPAALATVWGDGMSRSALVQVVSSNLTKYQPPMKTLSIALADKALREAKDWADLISFTPPVEIFKEMKTRNMRIHMLDDAVGDHMNLDHFAVEINKLPSFNGKQLTDVECLSMVHKNMNSYVDTSLSSFTPFTAGDQTLWLSDNPLRAVLKIEIAPDNAAVVVSEANATHWRFSTLYTEDTWDHPVSGTREFGLGKSAAGKTTIYSRGADRPTTRVVAAGYWFAFSQAAKLWKSFQEKIAEMINKNGGDAKVIPPTVKVVLWSELTYQPDITL
ncbi:MAG: hypothetical protein LQ342_001247 [Letrouitia transgressa]|nr:MAG: hypothetical protein LQ342_001247 [Letrouitia transgressa]